MIKFLFGCICVHTHSLVYQLEDGCWGPVLSFYHLGPRVKFRSSGLVTSTFPHPAVLSAPKVHFQVLLYIRGRHLSSISNKAKLTEILCILSAVGVTFSRQVTAQRRRSTSEQAQRIRWWFYLESVSQAPNVSV